LPEVRFPVRTLISDSRRIEEDVPLGLVRFIVYLYWPGSFLLAFSISSRAGLFTHRHHKNLGRLRFYRRVNHPKSGPQRENARGREPDSARVLNTKNPQGWPQAVSPELALFQSRLFTSQDSSSSIPASSVSFRWTGVTLISPFSTAAKSVPSSSCLPGGLL
jgi:hypothetical protein